MATTTKLSTLKLNVLTEQQYQAAKTDGQLIENEIYMTTDPASTTFTQAATRTNIQSGESHSTLFGKIMKWFADLGSLAFKSTVTTTDITNAGVTNEKLANTAAYSVKGNLTSSSAVPTDVGMLDITEYGLYSGTTTTSIADTEFLPISVSGTSQKKITWLNIVSGMRTKLFSTINGIPKLNGSGVLSQAVSGTDYLMPPTSATALPSSGTALSENTMYSVSAAVGTYQFKSPTSGWAHGFFSTGSTFDITFATGSTFLGEIPSFAASRVYEFDVYNGCWAISEVVS